MRGTSNAASPAEFMHLSQDDQYLRVPRRSTEDFAEFRKAGLMHSMMADIEKE
jgi:hypothetical protein